MKTQELRIGNYVNVPELKQCPFRIDLFDYVTNGIGKFGQIISNDTHPLTWYLQDLSPIPLTEEWLLRFGFKKIVHQFNMNDGSLCEHWELNGNDKYWSLYYCKSNFAFNEPKLYSFYLSHNKYVHQLQNLFFALTGQELTIKE